MASNPFDISFGKKPHESITRFVQSKEITDVFSSDIITQQIYMITGVRGSGKTVLMNTIAAYFELHEDWIVIRLNPDRDLLTSLGAKLCSHHVCTEIFRKAKINLSLFGFGMEIEGSTPIPDIESAIENMLKALKRQHKRLLITIDEVTNNAPIRTFAGSFQIFIGQELPVFLLMTGLYENIEALQNEKNLTFLYRAPKIRMTPLSINAIATRYADIFSLPYEQALVLAHATKGYPFAFQALGFSMWNHKDNPAVYMAEYRQLLEEYVYEKIWSELSAKDKRIADGIAHCPEGRISQINTYLGLKPNEINQYRKRLIRKGIADGDEHGYLRFTLPLFEQFVLDQLV